MRFPFTQQEDSEAKQWQNSVERKEVEGLLAEQEKQKNNLVQIHSIPTQIAKEIDKSNRILQ